MKVTVDAVSARMGGGLTYIRSIVPHLARRHDVTVVVSRSYQQVLADELVRHATVEDAGIPPGLVARVRYLHRTLPGLLADQRAEALFSVAEVATPNAPCASVVNVRNAFYYAPLLKRFQTRDPRVFSRYHVGRSLRAADRLLFPSETFRRHVVKVMRLEEGRTAVVPHGLSPAFLAPPPSGPWPVDQPYILAVGSLWPHKGVETLIDAFGRIAPEHPALHCVVIGDHADRGYVSALRHRAQRLGVADRTNFLGALPQASLPAYYTGTSGFVMTSRLESFGNPYLEAMGCGAPMVLSNLPIAHEMCQDAALYFRTGDASELASKLRESLEDHEATRMRCETGRRRAGQFTWERTAEQVSDALETAATYKNANAMAT